MPRTRETFIPNQQDTREEVLNLIDWVSDDILLINRLQPIRKSLSEKEALGVNTLNIVDLYTKEPLLVVFARQNGYGFDYLISVEQKFPELSGELKFLASVAVSKAILTDEIFAGVGFRCNKRISEKAHKAASMFFRRLLKPDDAFLQELQNLKRLFVPENRPFNRRNFGQHIGTYLSSFSQFDND